MTIELSKIVCLSTNFVYHLQLHDIWRILGFTNGSSKFVQFTVLKGEIIIYWCVIVAGDNEFTAPTDMTTTKKAWVGSKL